MLLLLIHAAATLYMTGLIWFVQVVHYPLMRAVGEAECVAYAHAHQRLTTRVVMPPMLVELATAVWLVVEAPIGVPAWSVRAGLAMVVLIWFSTFAIQVPAHRRLLLRADPPLVGRLVRGNWLRTALWSLRGVLALWMIAAAT